MSQNNRHTRNARFWHFHRHAYVKLTLKPGQIIRFGYSEPDEEGYSYEKELFEHEGDRIRNDWANGGRDCDGTIRRGGTLVCPVADLRFKLAHKAEDLEDTRHLHGAEHIRVPKWEQEGRTHQHDSYAAAMGY